MTNSNDALRAALEWYRDQMCEGFCEGFTPQICAETMSENPSGGDCAGCRAVVALNQPAVPVEAADDYMRIENAECEGMDKGADFCIKTLVEALGVADWEQADGSETWHGDVAGTIYNVLKAGRVYDEEDGRVARLEDAHPPEPAASTVAQGEGDHG